MSHGGEDGDMTRKTKLSEEHVSLLEWSFSNKPKPKTKMRNWLATQLGLEPRQVEVWFQNCRARCKTKKLKEEFAKLKSDHESTVVENRHLQIQVLKMKEQLSEAENKIQRLRSNIPSSSRFDVGWRGGRQVD